MTKYPKYKPTSLEWLSQIPSHWEMSKAKYYFKYTTGFTPPTGQEEFYNGDITWVTIADMNQKVISESVNTLSQLAIEKYKPDITKKQSLLFSFKLSVGKVAFADKDLYTNEAIISILPNDRYDVRYFYYTLPEQLLQNANENIYGAKMLNQELIRNASICFPPLEEQITIANFLDEKTIQIDKLISNKQKLIELLKEERTAIINEAISGEGTNWENRRLATLGKFFKGRGIKKDETKNVGFPCVRYGEIYTKYDRIIYETVSFIDEETSRNSELIKKGDVLFAGSGETVEDIGKAVVYFGDSDAFAGGDVIVLRLQDELEPTYASYLLNAAFVQHQKALSGKGEIIVHIYPKNIREITVPLPSREEQFKIVNYLDEQTKKIYSAISKIEKEIDLMQEYSTALISEVVTGKIKVV